MFNLNHLSDSELMELTLSALAELKARETKKPVLLRFRQSKGALVCTEAGVPADRPSWFHLPFLPTRSSMMFQPNKAANGGYIYEVKEEGIILRVRQGGEERRITTGAGPGPSDDKTFAGNFSYL